MEWVDGSAAGASNSRWAVVGSRLTVKVFWL